MRVPVALGPKWKVIVVSRVPSLGCFSNSCHDELPRRVYLGELRATSIRRTSPASYRHERSARRLDDRVVFGFGYRTAPKLLAFLKKHRSKLWRTGCCGEYANCV